MPSAIVLGSDPNGLAAALTLAKAGWRVEVLEPGAVAGSFAAGEEFHRGYRTAGTLHDDLLVERAVVERLGVEGLTWRQSQPSRWIAADGDGLLLDDDVAATAARIAKFSQRDAAHWPEFSRFIGRATASLSRLMHEAPPDVLNTDTLRTALQVGRTALSIRALGKTDMFELLRAMPMASRDFADDHFECEQLKAGLVAPGLLGTWGGPWSPGTVTSWLLRGAGSGPGLHGGPAALVRCMLQACSAAGVTVRTDAPATEVVVEDGAVRSVVLRDGTALEADQILSALDPRTTLIELLHPSQLPLREDRHISAFRSRGIVATVALALDRPIAFAGSAPRPLSAQVGGSLAALEHAFDPVKYGEDTDMPWLDVRVPTVESPELAPPGAEVVTVLATGFVTKPTNDHDPGQQAERRDAILDAVLDALEAAAPGVSASVVGSMVRSPTDIEAAFGLTGGHLWQGESALDQLLSFRPGPTTSDGRTPIRGLWLCGGGVHPGGGVRCAAGARVAKNVLAS